MTRPTHLPVLALLSIVVCLALGCWEVLTHQDDSSDTDWMDWDGSVQVDPASVELQAAVGESATTELLLTEVSARAGVEIVATLEGSAEGSAEGLEIDPGRWSLALVTSGTLPVRLTFSPADGATSGSAELVLTTSGSPAEIRVPITTTVVTAR